MSWRALSVEYAIGDLGQRLRAWKRLGGDDGASWVKRHTSPGGAPSMKADTAAALSEAMMATLVTAWDRYRRCKVMDEVEIGVASRSHIKVGGIGNDIRTTADSEISKRNIHVK